MKLKLNVLFTLNDAFVPQVATSICSIMEQVSSAYQIHFYLFSEGITPENQEKLRNFVHSHSHHISFIELEELETYFDFSFDTNGWSSIVLARLLVDKLLPEEVDKIIYLDGDTLAVGDIACLWNEDLKGKVLGMAPEPTVSKESRQVLDLKNQVYHNAGVMLIDLKKWREEKIGKKILDYYRQKSGQLFANDQDAINGSIPSEIQTLSIAYNYFNVYDTYPYRALVKISQPAPFVDQKAYEAGKSSPVIIHFLGEERPWRRWNTHRFSRDYHQHLEQTPWKDAKMEEGWFLYFQCFRLFNLVMKPFPLLRYKIITKLIPLFMQYRKKQLKKS